MAKVLCIDDEQSGLNIRKLLLESRGYEVLTAPDGPAGLDILQTQGADAVILDYRMANMNGELVAREIKARWPDLPVIMLSGYPDLPDTASEAADALIVKGQPATVLLEHLAALTGGKPPRSVTSEVERSRELLSEAQKKLDRAKRLRRR